MIASTLRLVHESGHDPAGRVGKAVFTTDRRYRLMLARIWPTMAEARTMTFGMLNPSTAGARVNDQTVTRCCALAAREGCNRVVVWNLSPLIATDPAELRAADEETFAGPAAVADRFIISAVQSARDSGGKVVLAWGAHGAAFAHRVGCVLGMVYREGVTPWCLGWTQNGQPRHPCRLAGDTPLVAMPF